MEELTRNGRRAYDPEIDGEKVALVYLLGRSILREKEQTTIEVAKTIALCILTSILIYMIPIN